jgi:hypothetical protein
MLARSIFIRRAVVRCGAARVRNAQQCGVVWDIMTMKKWVQQFGVGMSSKSAIPVELSHILS